ncbi:MAG: hypothetical protein H7Y27_11065 [Gemmatimonadaceae bacterium]|nr:hypothetical protein [Chitinophagaceae bacterium]
MAFNNRFIRLAVSSIAILLVFWVYNPFSLYFVNDDYLHIPRSALGEFGQSYLFRPVSEFSLWLDHRLWGKYAPGYHISNLLFHLCASLFLFRFVRLALSRLFPYTENQSSLATLSAVLFLIYPSHSESVFWILGRGASLSTCFTLLSLIFFMKSEGKWINTSLCLLFFLVAMFTYEIGFIIPFLMLILIVFEKKSAGKRFASGIVVCAFVLLTACLLLRQQISGRIIDDYGGENILNGNFYQLIYNFNALIARSVVQPLFSSKLFATLYLLALVVIGFILVRLYKTNRQSFRAILLFLLLFLVSLLPVIPLGIDTHDTEGGRFLYMPAIFLIPCLVLILSTFRSASLHTGLLAVYFACSLIYFSFHYKSASKTARETMQSINRKTSTRVIYAVDLPSQMKGALIFRKDFDKAVDWICPSLSHDSIVIVSTKEIERSQTVKEITGSDRSIVPGAKPADLILRWSDTP